MLASWFVAYVLQIYIIYCNIALYSMCISTLNIFHKGIPLRLEMCDLNDENKRMPKNEEEE